MSQEKINPATGYVHDDSQLEEPKEIHPVEEVVPEEKAAE
jgi:hypothetical protein